MVDPGLLAEFADSCIADSARLDDRFLRAVNDRNVDGVITCFADSPELVVVLHGNVLRGQENLCRSLTAMFEGLRTVHLEIVHISRWLIGDTVFAVGSAAYRSVARDGSRFTASACWTDARKLVAGRWLYILAHATEIPVRYDASQDLWTRRHAPFRI